MTNNLANFVLFDGKKITGNISTLVFDIDITGEAVDSDNDRAPKFRLFAKSPRGKNLDIGGIWERKNQEGKYYFTVAINTGHSKFYANLGRYPAQDDDYLYAIIPNDYLNNQNSD